MEDQPRKYVSHKERAERATGETGMTRRKFIKTTGATAFATAGAATGARAASNTNQAKGKKSKRIVSTDRAPKPVGPYSQAIVAGNTVYVAGQGPFDPKTGKMPATFEEQVVQVLENIKAIVEAAGATFSDVVKVNVYLADLANFAKMNEVYKRYFTEDYPARATVGTQLLAGMSIEVECIAVKG
jgi:2-iminobutanoate/2-iminopropanoate deaminase